MAVPVVEVGPVRVAVIERLVHVRVDVHDRGVEPRVRVAVVAVVVAVLVLVGHRLVTVLVLVTVEVKEHERARHQQAGDALTPGHGLP